MRRRDFVKGIVAIPVATTTVLGQEAPKQQTAPSPGAAPAVPPGAPVPQSPPASFGTRGRPEFKAPPITSVVPDAIATPEVRFFTEPQLAALRRLSDLLMPPLNGSPGALMAEAPEFLDFLAGVSSLERQELYRSGLNRLNAEAQRQFRMDFAHLNAAQADTIIRPALVPWITDHPPAEPFACFIAIVHQDVRTATMNSEVWSVAAVSSGERAPGVGMYWSAIDPDLKRWS